MIKNLLFVFLGGGGGSVLRYLLTLYIPVGKSSFPMATFLANALGCLFIGWLFAYFLKQDNAVLKLLLISGFCGGFTTFSTFSNEAVRMMQQSQWTSLFTYIALTLFTCFSFTWLGYKLG